MHLQIVTFELEGITPEQYADHCEQAAPRFAQEPGLRSKVWLADPDTGTYGGVYLWQDRGWAQRHADGPLRGGLLANPQFSGVQVRDLGVLDAPTAITRWGFSHQPA